MFKSCQTDGCSSSASEVCLTCKENSLLCVKHANDHMRSQKTHDVQEFLTDLSKENFSNVSNKILILLQSLHESKKNFDRSMNSLLSALQSEYSKALNFYKNLEFNLVQLIKTLKSSPEKILKVDLSLLLDLPTDFLDPINSFNLSLPLESFSSPILSSTIAFYDLLYRSEFFSQNLVPLPEYLTQYTLTRNTVLVLASEEKKEEPQPTVFYPNDKEIRLVHLEDLSTEVQIFNDKVPSTQGASAALYEKDVWFYYFEGLSYLLDLKHKTSMKIVTGRQKYFARGCVYLNGCVYLFGGVGGKNGELSVREAERFSFESNQWKQIEHLPGVFKSTSAAVVENKIYLAGYLYNSLMNYDWERGGYSEVGKLTESPRCKIVCGNFVLMNRSNVIWEIVEGEVRRIEVEEEMVFDVLAVSSVFHNQKFAYFVAWDGKLFRFNKFSFKLDVLSNELM